MKKIFMLLCILLLCVSSVAFAGEKQITFAWEKTVIELDLAKFEFKYTTVAPPTAWTNDPATWINDSRDDVNDWVDLAEVAYDDSGDTSYTTDVQFASPDGQTVQYWFKINAVDDSGNKSSWCYGTVGGVMASAEIDFDGPDIPVNFTLTVDVVPGP